MHVVQKVSGRQARKQLAHQAPAVEAALTNEQVTRQRVDQLEAWATVIGQILGGRTIWGRLRWLLTGR